MARWSAECPSLTLVAVADTVAVTPPYLSIKGGSSTQRSNLIEVFCGGQAGASSPTNALIGRCSTVSASSSPGGFLAQLDPATANLAANPTVQYNSNGSGATNPQRLAGGSGGHLINLSFNAFGGLVRWQAAPNSEEIGMLGNTANNGELLLSAFTGGTPGAMGAHIIFEPF